MPHESALHDAVRRVELLRPHQDQGFVLVLVPDARHLAVQEWSVNMKAETESRIFSVDEYVRPSNGEPIRSVVLETNDSVVVVWHAYPRQEIAAHVHPHGQDTWTVISCEAKYYQGNGVEIHLKAGDIAIAKPGQVHGAVNSGPGPFIFVSVVAPGSAGFALSEK